MMVCEDGDAVPKNELELDEKLKIQPCVMLQRLVRSGNDCAMKNTSSSEQGETKESIDSEADTKGKEPQHLKEDGDLQRNSILHQSVSEEKVADEVQRDTEIGISENVDCNSSDSLHDNNNAITAHSEDVECCDRESDEPACDHMCHFCSKNFLKRILLSKHLKEHNCHMCVQCGETFSQIEDYNRHVKIHNQCKECGTFFNNKSDIEVHSNSECKPEDDFSSSGALACEKFGLTSDKFCTPEKHSSNTETNSDADMFSCTVCDEKFSKIEDLENHTAGHVKSNVCDKRNELRSADGGQETTPAPSGGKSCCSQTNPAKENSTSKVESCHSSECNNEISVGKQDQIGMPCSETKTDNTTKNQICKVKCSTASRSRKETDPKQTSQVHKVEKVDSGKDDGSDFIEHNEIHKERLSSSSSSCTKTDHSTDNQGHKVNPVISEKISEIKQDQVCKKRAADDECENNSKRKVRFSVRVNGESTKRKKHIYAISGREVFH